MLARRLPETSKDAKQPARKVRSARSKPDSEMQIQTSTRFDVANFNAFYGSKQVLYDVNLKIPAGEVTAMIGPSGCGKSTFLRSLNRINETVRHARVEGEVLLDGEDIMQMDVVALRRRVGMVFQRANPFPKSIFQNVAYGLKVNGRRENLDSRVERSLKRAALWDEVKDRLHKPALALSGGQQQRLCIARALAVDPEVLLLDEPCSALDPASTAKIEDLLIELKSSCTVVIVTHNMQQAARVSDFTAFMLDGKLIEYSATSKLFTAPADDRTEAYISGRFG